MSTIWNPWAIQAEPDFHRTMESKADADGPAQSGAEGEMSDSEADKLVRRVLREIKRAKISEPGPDQYVGPCHWSKTGWGIWNKDGGCTCKPAKAPRTHDVRR